MIRKIVGALPSQSSAVQPLVRRRCEPNRPGHRNVACNPIRLDFTTCDARCGATVNETMTTLVDKLKRSWSRDSDLPMTSSFSSVELVTDPERRLESGNSVQVNLGTLIRAGALVPLGDSVSIRSYCITDDTKDADLSGETAPIRIERGTWLAGRRCWAS